MNPSKRKSIADISQLAVQKITDPFTKFLHLQQASGYLLLAATIIALVLANSPFGENFIHFWHTPIHFVIGEILELHLTVEQFINDGLMTIFFVVVGLEIKRELIEGSLSTREQAILPVVGALGGMLFPALIYLGFNFGSNTSRGWAIPTATDIAFTLAVIQMLGKRVPLSLKVFLTALAVVDDLGAIIVIAVFYSSQFNWLPLVLAFLMIGILYFMNFARVRNIYGYCLVGIFLWIFLHDSGIHATIAGVVVAFCVPFRFYNYETLFYNHLKEVQAYALELGKEKDLKPELRDEIIQRMQETSTLMEAPLNNLLHLFHKTSSYFIMPLFALCNAGVKLDVHAVQNLLSPLSLGIFFGLLLGKSLGITATTYITSKIGVTTLPKGVTIGEMFMVNILAGIGFTMSMFVANLAFNDPAMIETAKLSIIISSAAAGGIGFFLIKLKR